MSVFIYCVSMLLALTALFVVFASVLAVDYLNPGLVGSGELALCAMGLTLCGSGIAATARALYVEMA